MTSFLHGIPRRVTAAVPVLACVAFTAVLAGCGSASPSAAPASRPAARQHRPSSHPATSAAASSPAPSATASPAVPAAASGCLSRYLHAAIGLQQGTAGSAYAVIVFKNLDNQACALYGYPGVSFGAGTPVRQVGLAAAESTAAPRRLVTLSPGGFANALLRIVDAGNSRDRRAGRCRQPGCR
jgi:hypothetical protein